MQIDVSGKNEFEFIPEIAGNENEPKEKQWRIVVKKVNFMIEGNKFSFKTTDGRIDYDNFKFIEKSIVKHINPPNLKIDDKKTEELTTDILLSDTYAALFPVVRALYFFLIKLVADDAALETKKS